MDTILIIGCCGRVGSELLKELVKQKSCHIIGCDINSERIESLRQVYKSTGYSNIHLLTLNVNSEDGFYSLKAYMNHHKLTLNGAVYAAFPQDAWSRGAEAIPNTTRISNYLGDELSSIILFVHLYWTILTKMKGAAWYSFPQLWESKLPNLKII